MTPLFKSISEDIFNKLDMINRGILGLNEFTAFCECINYSEKITQSFFQDEILENFSSTKHITQSKVFGQNDREEDGLTIQGF
jgi:hypothetical protein